jgi:hypothetical protein
MKTRGTEIKEYQLYVKIIICMNQKTEWNVSFVQIHYSMSNKIDGV